MGKRFLGAVGLFFLIGLAAAPSGWAQVVPSEFDSLIVVPVAASKSPATVSITISMTNSRPISGISGRLVFDPNIITPQVTGQDVSMATIGRGTALGDFGASTPQPGVVTFLIISQIVSPIQRINIGSGNVCRIDFNVVATVDTTVCLQLINSGVEGEVQNGLSDTLGFSILPSVQGGSLQVGAGSATGGCSGGGPPPGPGNDPPVINPIAAQTVPQGSILSFQVRASDPDGDNVTLSATSLPQNGTFTTVTGDSVVSGTFTFTPSLSQLGNFTATFRAVDDSAEFVTRSVPITVTAVDKDILFSSSVTGKAPTGAIPGKRPAFFPIDLTIREQVYGVQFDLKIDTAILQLDSIIPTQRLENFIIDFRNIGGQLDHFRVLAFSLQGDSVRPAAVPTIMNLALSVSPNALPGKSAVAIDSGYESVNPDPRVPSQSMLTESGEFFIDRFGDTNLDTLINVADAVALVGFIIGNYPFSVRQFDAADTDRDSSADVGDLVNIINLIFGVPIPPPGPQFAGPPAELSLNSAGFAVNPAEPIQLLAKLPTDIAAAQVHLRYDPREIRLNLPRLTALSNGMILNSYDDQKGRLNLVLYGFGGARSRLPSGEGVILELPAVRFGDKLDPQITITGAVLSTPQAAEVPVKGTGGAVPRQFALHQNYPNPFNPKTTIRFSVGAGAVGDQTAVPVRLQIFNLLGQAVKTLVNDVRTPGLYGVEWDGTDLRGNKVSSGIYFYRLVSGKFSETKKMMFLK